MKELLRLFLAIILILLELSATAQPASKITTPDILLRDNKIQISYDILNSTGADRFYVRLEVTDSLGNRLDVKALEGDIGINVSGGSNKTILWDPKADGIYLDDDIFFQLYADKFPSTTTSKTGAEVQDFNRTGIILQSIAFPGLGLSRVTGKPHWLKGVLGYGCIAGSVVFNSMARNTYEGYKTPQSAENASALFNQSAKQDNISEILAYAAIGIWVTDIIWTVAGTSSLKKSQATSQIRRISLGTNYDHLSHSPLLAVRYKF